MVVRTSRPFFSIRPQIVIGSILKQNESFFQKSNRFLVQNLIDCWMAFVRTILYVIPSIPLSIVHHYSSFPQSQRGKNHKLQAKSGSLSV